MDRLPASDELSFRVGFSGHSGHLCFEPLPPVEADNPLRHLPAFASPPAFPQESTDTIKAYIKEKYLLPRLDQDEFAPDKAGRTWDFNWFDNVKIPLEPSLPRSSVVPSWELPFRRSREQSLQGTWEPESMQVCMSELAVGEDDSAVLPRITGPAKDFVRGSLNNRPFRPGGLDASQSLSKAVPDGASTGTWICEVLDGAAAKTIPPSFKQGLDFGELNVYPSSWVVTKEKGPVKDVVGYKQGDLSLQFDDLFKRAWEEDVTAKDKEEDLLEEETMKPEPDECKEEVSVDIADVQPFELDDIFAAEPGVSAKRFDEKNDEEETIKEVQSWAVAGGSEELVGNFYELVPDMALEFPFELDSFQKEAIYHLEKGESVFVAAHTSAGKTVVAEYAFALATKHCTRAVYTAPIKTISNQKYRDFCGKFDVGLLTGDVSLRPEASCLIMTTEILRSMLYRGADIIRDIEWVIFDEVHYVNDAERGVVWEEVIIMLPRHINVVLLSATVPNTIEFADWIGRTKQKKICVTMTTKRPVPLEHYLCYCGELYKICDNEVFLPSGVKAAKDAYKKKTSNIMGSGSMSYSGPSSGFGGGGRNQSREYSQRGRHNKNSGSRNAGNFSGASSTNLKGGGQNSSGFRGSDSTSWTQLINKLLKMSLLPVVVFCFSKNRCDKSADAMMGTDLTSSKEKSEIRVFCDKAFSRLKGSDRNLPQILRVQSLLHRGIGVHHAGLLPIVKEVVEMLFCRGVIKVLFSTETFAMGVNAPARTVVFDTLRKFDGKEFRQILPGEYTQMAGRAGRRGLDKIGTVIVMCRDEIPEESVIKNVMVGTATLLESQFRLTYIMILHLLRVEELKVEDMLKRSFAEFHAQKKLPEKEQLLMLKLSQQTKPIECIKGEPAIEEYFSMYSEAQKYLDMINKVVLQSNAAQQFLTSGRIVVVKSTEGRDHLLGAVVKASPGKKEYIVLVLKPNIPPMTEPSSEAGSDKHDRRAAEFGEGIILKPKSKRFMDDEYYSAATSRKGTGAINIVLPFHGSASGVSYVVREVETNEFVSICNCRIKVDQVGLLENVSTAAYSKTVQQLLDLKADGNKFPPALNPVKDLKLHDVEVVEAYYKWNKLLENMTENKCHGCIKLDTHMELAEDIFKHKTEVDSLKFQMSDEALQQMPDFQGRVFVLKEIGCIDDDLVIQVKGRVACEMNSGEELICTECLFENQLDDLEPEEAVALMSAFVFQQKKTSDPSLTPKLAHAIDRLNKTAITLGETQVRHGLQIDPREYAAENLKFGLVEVVYEWAKGTPFADICELSDVPEGMIVRTIVRLDETCREFRNAASIMGNSALYNKMEAASNAIKRDIVFAASLYITGV